MNKIRLGVNIDHVATLRNARGESYPKPIKAALVAQSSGADSITIHLREDRRHINDEDLKKIKRKIKIPLNLEMAPTKEMIKIAVKSKPQFVCLVPEKRKEVTTEGGLNLLKFKKKITTIVKILKKNNIRASLFIEPKNSDIILAKKIGSECVELHTGKYCNLINKKKRSNAEFKKIKKAALLAHSLGLKVHAGHGLTYKSAEKISKIRILSELNIGHFLISESLFGGLKNTIKTFKRIINK